MDNYYNYGQLLSINQQYLVNPQTPKISFSNSLYSMKLLKKLEWLPFYDKVKLNKISF